MGILLLDCHSNLNSFSFSILSIKNKLFVASRIGQKKLLRFIF